MAAVVEVLEVEGVQEREWEEGREEAPVVSLGERVVVALVMAPLVLAVVATSTCQRRKRRPTGNAAKKVINRVYPPSKRLL